MDFLGTLVTPSRRTRYGAEAGAPAGILIIDTKTNPLPLATTPPAIYTLLNGGGFVVWDQSTAGELARRGFSVSTHDVLPAEAAWLTANSQSWVAQGRPMLVWFLLCPGAVTLDAQGLPVCGGLGIPGVSEVAPKPGTDACSVASLPESIEGEVTTAQLEAAKRLAPSGTTVCFRYFAGNPGKPTPAQESAARTTIRNYDRLSQSVEQMSAQRQRAGRPLSPSETTAIANARVVLATYAQPVEKARPYVMPAGSRNARRARSAQFGVAPVVWALVALAVAVSGVALAIAVTASEKTNGEIIAAQEKVNEAVLPMIDELTKCAADPARTDAQRQSCVDALNAMPALVDKMKPTLPSNEWMGDAVKYGVIGVGIIAAVYLIGPAVRAASTSTAASLGVAQQKNLQRRKLVSELSR